MARRRPKTAAPARQEENLEAILENDVKEGFDVFDTEDNSTGNDQNDGFVSDHPVTLPETQGEPETPAEKPAPAIPAKAEEKQKERKRPKPELKEERKPEQKSPEQVPSVQSQSDVNPPEPPESELPEPEEGTKTEESVLYDGELGAVMEGRGSPTVYICPICGTVYSNKVTFCPKDGHEVVNIGTAENVWRNMSEELRTQIIADVMAGDIKNAKAKKVSLKEKLSKWYQEKASDIAGHTSELLMKYAVLFLLAGAVLGIVAAVMIMNFGEFSGTSILLGILAFIAATAFAAWFALFGYAFGKHIKEEKLEKGQ